MTKLLAKDIQNLKGRRKITKVTALDYCKKYISFFEDSLRALEKFKDGIDSGQFPKENNSFEVDEEEFNLFKDKLKL